MNWPVIIAGALGLITGAALATWWHRTWPERRRRIGEILAEICEDLD